MTEQLVDQVIAFDVSTFARRCVAFMSYWTGKRIDVEGAPHTVVWVDHKTGRAGVKRL